MVNFVLSFILGGCIGAFIMALIIGGTNEEKR